jgi:hypothetical protein
MVAPQKRKPRTRQDTANQMVATMASRDAVARRAYELFLERGRTHGRDLQDWLDAERQLRADSASPDLKIDNPAAHS